MTLRQPTPATGSESQDNEPSQTDQQTSEATSQAEQVPVEHVSTPPESENDAPLGGLFSDSDASILSPDHWREQGFQFLQWLQGDILTIQVLTQIIILAGALVPAAIFGPRLKKLIKNQCIPILPITFMKKLARALAEIATPLALYITLQVASSCLNGIGFGNHLVQAGVALLSAWIVIRVVTLVIRSEFWSKVAFYIAWPVAALDAFNLLDNVFGELEKISFPIGENDLGEPIRFSALDAIRVMLVFAILFWIANLAKRFLSDRIQAVDELTPSIKALLIKIIDILMPVVALLIALQLVGFNLATLTIFGGAIGLGIGLGLQKTISNFIAGFTLVADKSIKPGDVIEVEETFGWVTQMGTRYVTVRTRDGTEHLVPNDRFIESGVVNWSHQDKIVRLHIEFGVSYDTKDLRALKVLCEETALQVDRVLKTPAPVCHLVSFGDNSVNFDMRIWISDPSNGITNVRSEVMLAIWDCLKENNIEIPYPQRDLHIKSMPAQLSGLIRD